MAWSYQREETSFAPLPEGKYRIRVKEVEKAESKSGNEMLVFQFDVSGSAKTIYYYLVFMPDRPEITNGKLTQFFDSFKDIPDGDFNLQNWVGKVGAAMIKHEEYNGEKRERISYFIKADKQDSLPPWQEDNSAPIGSGKAFVEVAATEYDVPF